MAKTLMSLTICRLIVLQYLQIPEDGCYYRPSVILGATRGIGKCDT